MRTHAVLVIAMTSACGCGGCDREDAWEDMERGTFEFAEDDAVEERMPSQHYFSVPPVTERAEPPRPSFEDRYREFLERDAEWQRCVESQGSDCTDAWEQRLLTDLESLTGEFPDRSSALAPDFVRLRKARVVEIEEKFRREGFQLDVDYGAREERYWECARQCDRFGDDRRAYERCTASRPRACGEYPEVPFRCVLDRDDLEEYLELLLALGTDVPPEKVRRVRHALARALENPSPFHCEGESHPDYERAYTEYEVLGDRAAMRRVAKKRAQELLGNACEDGEVWIDDDVVPSQRRSRPPACHLELLDLAEAWLAKAGAQPDRQWRAQISDLADWASATERVAVNPQLPCDAIVLAKRADDAERIRKLTLAYGSQCAAVDGGSGR